MIKLNDVIELTIEKNVYGGEGLARYSEENFVVFVNDVLKGEKVKAQIISLNKKYAKAKLIEVIKPAEKRIKPICPLYNACGSCDCGCFEYDYLVETKTEILKDTFKNIIAEDKIYPVIKSPDVVEYRHKIQYPAQQTKNSKRILLGYYEKHSHKLTNIKFCPLQPQLTNEIIQFVRDNFELDCYDEKTNKGLLKNVLMRISKATSDILLTLVLNCDEDEFSEKYDSKIFKFFRKITSKYSQIKGGFVNFNPKKSNKILGDKLLKIQGEDNIIEILDNKKFKIGATSFFQVNPSSARNLFDIVKENIEPNSTLLDAYGGVGAISIYASDKIKKITLVEENENATTMAKDNFELNNIQDYEIFNGDAKKQFNEFQKENKTFDYVVLDPPRSGCEKEGLEVISKLAKNIIYVSCNPQTLKRDMAILMENKFIPQFVKGVDLFPYTHHIESVVLFKRIENV